MVLLLFAVLSGHVTRLTASIINTSINSSIPMERHILGTGCAKNFFEH